MIYIASLLPLTLIHQAQELAEYKRQWLALRRLRSCQHRGKKAYTIIIKVRRVHAIHAGFSNAMFDCQRVDILVS